MITIWTTYLFPCLCAFAACLGFTLLYNIHGTGQIICGAGGALGWLVYLLCGSTIPAAFAAAFCIGVWAEMMSRLRRCPVTGYMLVALLPLVPGGGVYYAMSYCIAGETERFFDTLLHTFGMALALAVGSMLASSVFRTFYAWLRRQSEELRNRPETGDRR